MASDDLITTAEACEILGIERSTLIRWTQGGQAPKITPAERLPVGGRYGAYRFRRADVEALAVELAARGFERGQRAAAS